MRWMLVGVVLAWSAPAAAADAEQLRSIDIRTVCRAGPRTELERRLCTEKRYVRARSTRRAGQVLTIMGAAPIALAGAFALVGYISCTTNDCGEYGVGPIVLSGLIAGAGVPFVSLGIPLWASGRKRELRLRPIAEVNPSSAGGRIGLVVEF